MFNDRTHLLILGVLAAFAFGLPSAADAASGSTSPQTAYNAEDLYYDFDVYIAEDVTMYRLIVHYEGGNSISLIFETLEEAEMYEVWLTSDNVVDTEIVEEQVQGPWEYLITYDKRATAEAIADYAEYVGYYAKVERVSIFSYQISR
jgi:hypothetical protein